MARLGSRGGVVVVVVLAVAVAVGLVLVHPRGGGIDPPDPAERRDAALRHAIGHPAGAAAVEVGAGLDPQGRSYVATLVTLDQDATGAEVAAIVAGLPTAVARVGLPSSYADRELAFVTAAGSRLTIAWQPQVDVEAVTRSVDGWLAVGDTLGRRPRPAQPATAKPATAQPATAQPATAQPATAQPAADLDQTADVAAILLTGGDISYRLSLGVVTAPEVLAAYQQAAASVAREPAADQAEVQWDVSGTAGAVSLRLTSNGPLDSARQQEWTTLLDDADRLGAPLGLARLEAAFGDRVEVHLTVLAPDQVPADGFTPAAYGRDVWPTVRPQLRSLAAQTVHWSFFLSWAHRSHPAGEQLLALLFGDQGTVRDGAAAFTGWAADARAFLASP